jgi:1-hydroxycarotenoid 3,4-desaturase
VTDERVAVVGAGVGGLVAALDLAAHGARVTVFEKALAPGGKMRELSIDGIALDAGPTVFTMRWVFEALFSDLGLTLSDHLTLRPLELLARHAWSGSAIATSANTRGAYTAPLSNRLCVLPDPGR